MPESPKANPRDAEDYVATGLMAVVAILSAPLWIPAILLSAIFWCIGWVVYWAGDRLDELLGVRGRA